MEGKSQLHVLNLRLVAGPRVSWDQPGSLASMLHPLAHARLAAVILASPVPKGRQGKEGRSPDVSSPPLALLRVTAQVGGAHFRLETLEAPWIQAALTQVCAGHLGLVRSVNPSLRGALILQASTRHRICARCWVGSCFFLHTRRGKPGACTVMERGCGEGLR